MMWPYEVPSFGWDFVMERFMQRCKLHVTEPVPQLSIFLMCIAKQMFVPSIDKHAEPLFF
jgi:hypothetical protein